jgi:hypothetical protein
MPIEVLFSPLPDFICCFILSTFLKCLEMDPSFDLANLCLNLFSENCNSCSYALVLILQVHLDKNIS